MTVVLLAGCSADTAGPNRAPVASAGSDQVRDVGTIVELDGSGSFDPDGDELSFQWSILSAPVGAQAAIAVANQEQTTIEPELVGVWMIGLFVTDIRGLASDPDVLQLRVLSTICVSDDDCDDGISCTTNHCDIDTGVCSFTADDGLCADDGLYCNGPEICDAEKGCMGAGNPCLTASLVCDEDADECVHCTNDGDCDDGIDCTVNHCDSGAGECDFTPDDGLCADDGLYCNGQVFCDAAAGCLSSGDPCLTQGGVCDEENDVCTVCGDGVLSTGEDCDPGVGQGDHCCDATGCHWVTDGQPDPQAFCSGADECQLDVCDGSGACKIVSATDGAACNSNDVFCDGAEECQAGVCVSPGNPCSIPTDCDEANDICGGCGDGVVGSGEDCDPATPASNYCCNPATCKWIPNGQADPQGSCSGAPVCQVDVCDGMGACAFSAVTDGVACGDGSDSECDNPDNCQGGACLVNIEPIGTVCRQAAGECDKAENCDGVNPNCPANGFVPAGTQCSDLVEGDCYDAQCDGAGNCDQDHAFEPDGTSCAGDGVNCTLDECTGGACNHTPDNNSCPDDGLYCNGAEFCDSTNDCSRTGNPCVNPSDCDETSDRCTSCGDGFVTGSEDCDPAAPANDNCCDPTTCLWTANGQADPQGQCSGALVCNKDVCDGNGSCKTVPVSADTLCGDQADDDCTNPDSCDGAGVCQPNNELPGTACGTATFCGGSGSCDDDGNCQAFNSVAGDYCDGDDLVHCDGVGGESSRLTCTLGCAGSAPNSRCLQVDPSNIPQSYLCSGSTALVINAPATIDTDSGDIYITAGNPIAHSDLIVTQTAPGVPIRVFSFSSIQILEDVSVVGTRPLALLSCGDAYIDAVINACGRSYLGGPGGRNGGGSESDGSGYYSGNGKGGPGQDGNPWSCGGGGGGAFGDEGGKGGDGSASYIGGAGGGHYGTQDMIPLLGGSGGGGGGDWDGSDGGVGGGGGGAMQITAGGTLTITSGNGINACGAGGGTATAEGEAGGGGGSGGGILLEGVSVTIDGILAANGGGGGGGDGYGDGVLGEAGHDGSFGTDRARGGDGVDGWLNTGGDGGQGGAADEPYGDDGEDKRKGGGGGGATGRIRINTSNASVSGSFTLSPYQSTGLASFGTVGNS